MDKTTNQFKTAGWVLFALTFIALFVYYFSAADSGGAPFWQ
jgi:hypothetical protein